MITMSESGESSLVHRTMLLAATDLPRPSWPRMNPFGAVMCARSQKMKFFERMFCPMYMPPFSRISTLEKGTRAASGEDVMVRV